MGKKWNRLFYTAVGGWGSLVLGIICEVYPTSIVDLSILLSGNVTAGTDRHESNLDDTSLFFTFLCLGSMSGSLWVGVYKYKLTRRWLNRQLLTGIFLVIIAIIHSVLPWCHSFAQLYAVGYAVGFGGGTWAAVVNTWLMEMWHGKTLGSLLQANQVTYGVGTMLSPVIVRSYIHGYANDTKDTIDLVARRHDLTIPFMVTGSLELSAGFLLLIGFILCRYYPFETEDQTVEGKADHPVSRILDHDGVRFQRMTFHGMIMLLIFSSQIGELIFNNFQHVYFQELGFSAKQSVDLVWVGTALYTLGRIITMILIRYLKPGTILAAHYGIAIIGFGSMLALVENNLNWWLMAISRGLIAYGISALFPTTLAFIESHTKVDERHNSLYFTAVSFPLLIGPYLVGHYVHKIPNIVTYLCLSAMIFAATIYISVRFLISRVQGSLRR